MDWIDWGNAPEWLAAVFTGGAFFITYRLLKTEIEARRTDEADRLERDARQVAAWWEEKTNAYGQKLVHVFVKNAGETPIYGTMVTIGPTVADNSALGLHFHMVPPGHTLQETLKAELLDLELDTSKPDEHGFYSGGWIAVDFTDTSGQHWRRNRNGTLRKRASKALGS